MSYAEIKAKCKEQGGEVARIDNAAQDKTVREVTKGAVALIGLHDNTQEGKFTWLDGSIPSYKNWAPNEPNDYGNGEDCTVVGWGDKWNDMKCALDDSVKGFVCSKWVGGWCHALHAVCTTHALAFGLL